MYSVDGNEGFIDVIKLDGFYMLSFEAWNQFIIILLLTGFYFNWFTAFVSLFLYWIKIDLYYVFINRISNVP